MSNDDFTFDSAYEVLDALESNGSRLAKEAILKAVESAEDWTVKKLVKAILTAGLNPYINYGVRKLNKTKPNQMIGELKIEGGLLDFVYHTLPKLAARELSGNAAKDAVESELNEMSEYAHKWAKRILLKNLRIGVQAKTVNKIWPDLIPKFEVQLAHSLDTAHVAGNIVINESVTYPVRIEPKLDGLRCIAVKTHGIVNMYTRNGREIETLSTIRHALESCGEIDNVVLDGEAMGEDWNESASIVGSKKNLKNDDNIVFNVFDAMTFNEWETQDCAKSLNERVDFVANVVAKVASRHVQQVPGVEVANQEELMVQYERALEDDFEGVMLKNPSGGYGFKRTRDVLKMKPVATYEGVVVGTYGGRDGTKRHGKFGGFAIVLPNGVVTRVGGGFNDKERDDIDAAGWDTFKGKIMEVEGQPPLTKDGRVRFPVFTRWRDESDVDPLVMEAYNKFSEEAVLQPEDD